MSGMVVSHFVKDGVIVGTESIDLDARTVIVEADGQVVEQRALTDDEYRNYVMAETPPPDLTSVIAARLAAQTAPALWRQPTGAHDAYLPGEVVLDAAGDRWRNTLTVPNVWPLDTYGWENLDATPPDGPQPWVQPIGSHDAYALGALVTHGGDVWESTVDANVWEPGVFGWVQAGA